MTNFCDRIFRRVPLILAVLFAVGTMMPGSSRAFEIALPGLSAGSATVNVGDTFTIPISVSGTAGLTSYQFDLSFDASILQVVSFDDSSTDFATEAGNEGGFLTGLAGFIDNTDGILSGAADSMSGNSGPGLTPGGSLVDIVFEALQAGTSALDLSNAFLTDNGNFLSSTNNDFALENGSVTVRSGLAVPEPGTLPLLGVALFVMAAGRRLASPRRTAIRLSS